jgi:nucleotide-binding universal stress UspA family protein
MTQTDREGSPVTTPIFPLHLRQTPRGERRMRSSTLHRHPVDLGPAHSPQAQSTGPILVAVSGSPNSEQALDWAAAEAAARGTSLRVVHGSAVPILADPTTALYSTPLISAAYEIAEGVIDHAFRQAHVVAPDLVVTAKPWGGSPAHGILSEAADHALVVLGRQRRSGRAHWPRRSHALRVVARTPVPVVVVGLSTAPEDGPSQGRVVVGVGASSRAAAVLDFAFENARRRGVGLTVVHAWTPPGPGADSHAYAATNAEYHRLKGVLASYRPDFPEVDVRLNLTPMPVSVALMQESTGAALTVIGAPRRRRPLNLLTNSTLRTVLHSASSPVAIVPTSTARPRPRQ